MGNLKIEKKLSIDKTLTFIYNNIEVQIVDIIDIVDYL